MGKGEHFLVGDLGATKICLYLARYENEEPKLVERGKYLCHEFHSLEEVVKAFLKERKVSSFVCGVPGPVEKGKAKLTNLLWKIEEEKLSEKLKIQDVVIVNDLELVGYSISHLRESDLIVLNKGKKEEGRPSAVLSVGTGLGEVIVFEDKVLATEGGHETFAATTDEEIGFLKFMKPHYDHISYERVLSGGGIESVYEYFSGRKDVSAVEIFSDDKIGCKKTAHFFLKVLGREASNLSLKSLCRNGLYLTGGVLQKNRLFLQQQTFIEAFTQKGRLSLLLESIPVYLIKDNTSLLFGGCQILKKKTGRK